MYKTVQINYCRKVFCVTAYPCFHICTINIRVSIRVRGLHLVFEGIDTKGVQLAPRILEKKHLQRLQIAVAG